MRLIKDDSYSKFTMCWDKGGGGSGDPSCFCPPGHAHFPLGSGATLAGCAGSPATLRLLLASSHTWKPLNSCSGFVSLWAPSLFDQLSHSGWQQSAYRGTNRSELWIFLLIFKIKSKNNEENFPMYVRFLRFCENTKETISWLSYKNGD